MTDAAAATDVAVRYGLFIDAVTRQLARPAVAADAAADADDAAAELRSTLLAVIAAAARGPGGGEFDAATAVLRSSPRLLSSLFQNLDLLPVADPAGDGVALLIAAALDG